MYSCEEGSIEMDKWIFMRGRLAPLATSNDGETSNGHQTIPRRPRRSESMENDVVGKSKATSGFRLSHVDSLTAY